MGGWGLTQEHGRWVDEELVANGDAFALAAADAPPACAPDKSVPVQHSRQASAFGISRPTGSVQQRCWRSRANTLPVPKNRAVCFACVESALLALSLLCLR